MPTPRAAGRDRKVDGDSGFTLVETLVSVTLLALVGGGATTGIVAAAQAQSTDEARTAATNLARADLDTARAIQYPNYPTAVARYTVTVGARTFSLSRTVTAAGVAGTATCPDVITSSGVLALVVTSTVAWDADRRTVSMQTVVAC